MSQAIQNLLRKINYIEADIEIHKQILFSMPSDKRIEIENTLKIIAAKKGEVDLLRKEIRKIDPEWYNRILVFEKAIKDFKHLAGKKKFQSIISKNPDEPCTLSLSDMTEIECLIKACDENGDWTIITPEGQIRYFASNDVSENIEQQPATD